MTFFQDLTPHTYTRRAEEPGVYNVGWLGEGRSFPTGPTSEEFRAALKELCDHPIHLHRGVHVCEFCRGACGSGQIRVCSQTGVWYVAPTMIHHYVVAHEYRPPEDFIAAVMNPREIAIISQVGLEVWRFSQDLGLRGE
jgi:hypothetical protein